MHCKIKSDPINSSTNSTMTIKEQLIQEVESFPDALLAEALDFVLFLKPVTSIPKSPPKNKTRSPHLNPPMN